jgi:hypothetical protein
VSSPTKSTIIPCWRWPSLFHSRNRLSVSVSGNGLPGGSSVDRGAGPLLPSLNVHADHEEPQGE